MKNKILFILSILVVLLMTSCTSKNNPDVSGKWTSQLKFKTSLPSDANDPNSPECGVMISIQEQTLELSNEEEGNFKTTVKQYIQSVEFTGPKPEYFVESDIKALFEYETVFSGKYRLKEKYIEFLPEEVEAQDGTIMNFNDFAEYNDGAAAAYTGHKGIELSEDKSSLTIADTKYSRM